MQGVETWHDAKFVAVVAAILSGALELIRESLQLKESINDLLGLLQQPLTANALCTTHSKSRTR